MITICVPIFNTSKYLRRCIDSLINQSYQDLEIVLIDDGSTDNSGDICDEYQKEDSRIKVIHQCNKGEATARNTGLQVASGEYVAFCDSDDEYSLDAIEKMYKATAGYDYDLVLGGYIEKHQNQEYFAVAHSKIYEPCEAAASMLKGGCKFGDMYILSTVNGKLFKTSLIRENKICFNENFRIGNDTLFICEYMRNTDKIYNTFLPVYTYYKYDPTERVQGMAWYYPDSFVHDALVRFSLLEILYGDKNLIPETDIIVQYMRLIKGLVDIVDYEEMLKIDLMSYIRYCKKEIPVFKWGAKLEVESGIILEKYKNNIPYRIISQLIYEERVIELVNILHIINKTEKNNIEKNNINVRTMIKLKD